MKNNIKACFKGFFVGSVVFWSLFVLFSGDLKIYKVTQQEAEEITMAAMQEDDSVLYEGLQVEVTIIEE